MFGFELVVKSGDKQWCLCYSEAKVIRSIGCGDDVLRDSFFLSTGVFRFGPLLPCVSPKALLWFSLQHSRETE